LSWRSAESEENVDVLPEPGKAMKRDGRSADEDVLIATGFE